MADFHFIRPLWLLLLIAAVVVPMMLRKFRSNDSGWSRVIPPRLLTPLIRSSGSGGLGGRSPALPLTAAIVLLAVALAGPSWRQAPAPLQQQNDSLVIVLDLSLSMLATDVEPDRLTLAKRKIRDIIDTREGSLTALVVYAADAHVVTPLTDDGQTITGMLDVLDPTIMPAAGNRADHAIQRALDLLNQGAPGRGRLLLISDGVAARYQANIETALANSGYTLNTLTVGTPEGGPIPLARQGFIRDQDEIVITRADPDSMRTAADAGGGENMALTLSDADIRALELRSEDADEWQDSERDLTVDRWQDDGYWLLWLAMPIALLAWRRGAVLLVLLTLLPLSPRPVQAQAWDSLWQREDQRAPELIRQNPEQAAQTLDDPDLRGSALYRQGEYDSAAEAFARGDAPSAEYNRANALARAGKLEEALKAYNQLLEKQPGHEDAEFNRDLVKELLDQQKQQKEQEQQEQQDQTGQQSEESGSSSEQPQESDQQGSENPSDNQGQDQQSQDQQQQNDQSGQQPEQNAEDPGQEQQVPEELDTSPLTQGQEQWLRRVPDDPGGLLRRKFLQQYQQRNTQTDEGDTPW